MPNITPLFCSIAILGALVSSVRAASLATAFDGPNGDAYSDGDKFSILTGDTPVTIHSLDLHMGEVTADVQVWINPEGFFDWMYKSGVHEKVMEIDDVTGLGQGLATPLPAFSPPIEIPANSNLGFYVTLNNSGGGNMYHSDGVTQNAVFASDDFISITEGISQRHFMSAFHIPTRWNGAYFRGIAGLVSTRRKASPLCLVASCFHRGCSLFVSEFPDVVADTHGTFLPERIGR